MSHAMRAALAATALLGAMLPLGAAASVAPIYFPGAGNRPCSTLEPEGATWLELKADPGSDGVYTSGNLTVTIANRTDDSFDWSSNLGVDAVYVKGGSGGSNLYVYPNETTGDTALVIPNAANNGISHISFCWDDEGFVPPESTLTLLKVALDPAIDLGETMGFGIIFGNGGPDPAADATLWDTLPAVSGNWSADNGACVVTGTNLTCSFGTVEVGGFRYVNLTAPTSAPGDCGPWTNVAYAIANGGLDDATSDPAQVYVSCADVGVQKTAAASPIDLGGNVSYTIVVTSYGPDAAEDVNVTDTLPSLGGAWALSGDNATECGLDGLALACAFGVLAPNETRTVTATATTSGVDDCGWQNNTAAVSARLDWNAANDAGSASVYVRCSDPNVTKLADAPSLYLGGVVGFTIQVGNAGPDAATNVTLTDPLPDPPGNWSIASADGACSIENGTLACDLGDIPAGETRSVRVTAPTTDPAADCGLLSNSAAVGADVDLDAANDVATANVSVLCSDLSVAKVSHGDVYLGGNVTFTITVTSEGPDPAVNATLTDALPSSPGAWEIAAAEGSCAIVAGVLACDLGTLPMGAQRNVTVTSATSAASECGAVTNAASVGADVDTLGANDAANATATVLCSDVGATKTAANATIDVGSSAAFTLTITSYGPDPALNATLTDALPAIAGNWTVGTPDGGACDVALGVLTCAFGTLAAGEQRNVTLWASTALADCGPISNAVVAGADVDVLATNDEANASVYVTCADVSMQKTAASASILVGQNATFTLTVTSLGPDAAENVTVVDALPDAGAAWELVPADDFASCAIVNGTLSCSFGTLPANATRVVTLTAATTLAACDGVSNTAIAYARLDTLASNDASTATVDVTCADVGVEKSAGAATVARGQNLTWTVVIRSLGPDAATNVTVSDVLANGSVLALAGNASSYCSEAAGVVTCSIPTMPAGTWLALDVVTSTASLACGPVNNTATVGALLDTNASNDQATASAEVLCPSVTRTIGFWQTHTNYTRTVFEDALGGAMSVGTGGHVRLIDTDGKLFGAFYASVPYKTDGHKRTQIDAARIVLLQQLVAAKLNCAAFGCNATIQSLLAQADAAYAGNSKAAMAGATWLLDAYNNDGDDEALPTTWGPQGSATPALSRAIANKAFWNAP